jgi:hypothetical protein
MFLIIKSEYIIVESYYMEDFTLSIIIIIVIVIKFID